jgi:transposase-like protein
MIVICIEEFHPTKKGGGYNFESLFKGQRYECKQCDLLKEMNFNFGYEYEIYSLLWNLTLGVGNRKVCKLTMAEAKRYIRPIEEYREEQIDKILQ